MTIDIKKIALMIVAMFATVLIGKAVDYYQIPWFSRFDVMMGLSFWFGAMIGPLTKRGDK